MKVDFQKQNVRTFEIFYESTGLTEDNFLRPLAKICVQDAGRTPKKITDHGGHLGFTIGTILAIFDLQVTPMLPSKFGVNLPFGSGEEAKNRFSRWRPPWPPSWLSDRNYFSYF